MAQAQPTSSQTILSNSIWYGLETAIEIVVFVASSIAVARYLGPAKLGHFQYIKFFVNAINRTAGAAAALAPRKYTQGYQTAGRRGIAYGLYRLPFRCQTLSALAIPVSTAGLRPHARR